MDGGREMLALRAKQFDYKPFAFLALCISTQAGCGGPWLWSGHANSPARMAIVRQEIAQAEAASDAGDLSLAETHLRRAMELNPKSCEAIVRLGKVQNQRQEWPAAKTTWQKVTSLDDDDPLGWTGLAEAETALGEFDHAVKHLKMAIDLAPHRAEPHLKLGELYEAQGQPNEALEAYLNCLNVELDNTKALMNAARLQRERGQAMQAMVRLNRVLDLSPDQADALLQRGLAHRDLGQIKPAVADLKRAVELQPDRTEIKLELALLMESSQNREEALKLVREVMLKSPELVGARELNERLVR